MNAPYRPKDEKTLSGAYMMAGFGLVLGVFGMHRHYLKQHIHGTVMSSLFLSGLVTIVHFYVGILTGMLDALVGLNSGGGNFAAIPELPSAEDGTPFQLSAGFVLCGAGFLWFAGEFIFLPKIFRRYRDERERSLRISGGAN